MKSFFILSQNFELLLNSSAKVHISILSVKTLRLKQDKTKCINVNNFQYGRELPQSKPVPHLQTNRPQQQPARCQCRPSQPRCFGKPFKSIVISLIELKAHATCVVGFSCFIACLFVEMHQTQPIPAQVLIGVINSKGC